MRNIKIAEDIYALLQRHAEPFVDSENDVLRRLLLAEDADGYIDGAPAVRRGPGDLMPYLDAGLLNAGDELVHEQPRKGRVHRALVAGDGWLEVEGHPAFRQVSPALKALVGNEINGWGQWTHVASGRRLQELRDELRRRQANGTQVAHAPMATDPATGETSTTASDSHATRKAL